MTRAGSDRPYRARGVSSGSRGLPCLVMSGDMETEEEVSVIKVKRIYESREREAGDGKRILVDRLWPRGLRKDEVVIDQWLKEIAPSNESGNRFATTPRNGMSSKRITGRSCKARCSSWKRSEEKASAGR